MAGTQNVGERGDNPVAINVTAMVDVIFCLCIFFMCSFHFKQLEGSIDSWLPTGEGPRPTDGMKLVPDEIRVLMRWDAGTGVTLRGVRGESMGADDAVLMASVCTRRDGFTATPATDWRLKIDAESAVPWGDVVHVMDLCRLEGIDRIEFCAAERLRETTAQP